MPTCLRVDEDDPDRRTVHETKGRDDSGTGRNTGDIRQRCCNVEHRCALHILAVGHINDVRIRISGHIEFLVEAAHVNDVALQGQVVFHRPVVKLEILREMHIVLGGTGEAGDAVYLTDVG